MTVHVMGLVRPVAPFNNSNPAAMFRAALSCQDPADSGKGDLFIANPAPATTGVGDADIEGQLQVPDSCFAPLGLITRPPLATSPNGGWFAIAGFPVAPNQDHDGDNS